MSQDFANGTRRKRSPRSDARPRARSRTSAFHLGSFGAGIALGVAFTLAGALLPEWWGNRNPVQPATQPSVEPTPITKFEFFDRLPNESISTHAPEAAQTPASTPGRAAVPAEPSREFLLQAGSFTTKEDADRLRDTLTQASFEAETAKVQLSSGAIRYRVIVGPFATSRDTQRAITQLRKQDVDALVLARKPGAG